MPEVFVVRRIVAPVFAAAVMLASCNRDNQIVQYRAPKEKQPDAPAPAAAATDAPPATLHWSAPAGWEEQPASGFRKGSFLIRGDDGKTADVSVISFPQAAGGVLANVNRWRDQLKLAPISNPGEVGTPMAVAGRDMFFVDLVSEQPVLPDGSKSRILGGIMPLNGETWFFKMAGPDALVESQRDPFKQFLQSVHVPEGDSAPVAAVKSEMGASTNAPTPPPIESAAGQDLHYTLPPNWQEKPLTPMRLASFSGSAPNGKQVDISVVSLGGPAGGKLANVNRWRDQVKLPPIDEAALEKSAEHTEANGHDYLVVDLVSADPIGDSNEKQRIVAATLETNERTWFVKMTGEADAVASQKDAFVAFLRSLQIP